MEIRFIYLSTELGQNNNDTLGFIDMEPSGTYLEDVKGTLKPLYLKISHFATLLSTKI